jgi:hypothetical protein
VGEAGAVKAGGGARIWVCVDAVAWWRRRGEGAEDVGGQLQALNQHADGQPQQRSRLEQLGVCELGIHSRHVRVQSAAR